MIRNRQATRERLLGSAEQQLIKKGFQAMGVNAIAARAGIDKVLIYRYFGGFDGLLEALASEREIWPELSLPEDFASELAATDAPGPLLWKLLDNHLSTLRGHSLAREILVWSAAELNVLTKFQIKLRRKQSRELQDAIDAAGISIQGMAPSALYAIGWKAQVFAMVENHRKENYKPKDWRVFDELGRGLFGASGRGSRAKRSNTADNSAKAKSKKKLKRKDKQKRK